MIDVVRVADIGRHSIEEPRQLAPGLERIDHFRHARELAPERILFTELELLDEVLRLWRLDVLGMLHRERDDLLPVLFEHAIVLEKYSLRAAAVIEVVVD